MPERGELALGDAAALTEKVLTGDRLALARLLTQVENDTPGGQACLERLFPYAGQAHIVGITGSPGTGKSSLVNQLARLYRRPQGEADPVRVAIIAVDPTSPFTGGAVLGDRVRMRDLAGDRGVFIRSMASRGALGGLAHKTASVAQVFDAAGYEVILIETVGAGQAEVDIARLAHTTVVVEAPGLGDDIQAIKAGILEIADILVVNKADRPGAENTQRALRMMLDTACPGSHPYLHPNCPPELTVEPEPLDDCEQYRDWLPPVLATVATLSTGVETLQKSIQEHAQYLRKSGEWQRRSRERIRSEFANTLQSSLVRRWRQGVSDSRYREVLDELVERRISPQQAVLELLDGTERRWARTYTELGE